MQRALLRVYQRLIMMDVYKRAFFKGEAALSYGIVDTVDINSGLVDIPSLRNERIVSPTSSQMFAHSPAKL